MERRIFITLFVTILAVALGASLVLPLLPVYAQELGASGLDLGLIFSGFALARSFLLPLVGSLADIWGRRRFILAGLFIYTLVAIGFDLAHSIGQLILCRLIQGVGAAMVIPLARAYVGDLTPAGHEGRIMGHFNLAFFAGLTLGPWLGGYIKDSLGISTAFYSMAMLAFFGFLLSFFNIPKIPAGQEIKHQPGKSLWALLTAPALAAVFLFRLGTTMGVGVNWAFLPVYGHDILQLSSTRIGLLISFNLLMTTLLQPGFGWLADRFSRPWMAVLGGILASLCLMVLPFCHSFTQLLVLNMAMGSAIGLYMPPLMAMAVDLGRGSGAMTSVMSILELAFSLAMVIGPLLAGLVKEYLNINAIFWGGGLVGLVTSFLFLLYHLRGAAVGRRAR